LKITGGQFKGTVLRVPSGRDLTRPTSDKVRQALFNILQGRAGESAFLDLYAGSGAVGLEALSRGYPRSVMVEKHPAAFACLEANCLLMEERGAEKGSLEWKRLDVQDYCKKGLQSGWKFSVVFADPPFGDDFTGLWDRVSPLIAEDGIGIIQFPSRKPPVFTEKAARIYAYGESSLAVFLV